MSYRYKKSALIIPPAPPPLPSGSIPSNPGYPIADFYNEAGDKLSLTFNDLRAILVHKSKDMPDIPFTELRSAFRDTIRLVPYTHSDVNNADIAAAYNPPPVSQP